MSPGLVLGNCALKSFLKRNKQITLGYTGTKAIPVKVELMEIKNQNLKKYYQKKFIFITQL